MTTAELLAIAAAYPPDGSRLPTWRAKISTYLESPPHQLPDIEWEEQDLMNAGLIR